jgi:hypothetical protein
MSCAAAITPAILDTILARLALLFLTGADGDLPTARHAASRMLAAYHAETPDELRLAAEVISFGLHALEALGQAASEDLALNRIIRPCGSAVSLSRESHKAQRKLDQLQRDRRAGVTEPMTSQAEPAMLPQRACPPPTQVGNPSPVPFAAPLPLVAAPAAPSATPLTTPLATPSAAPLADSSPIASGRPRVDAAISLVESGRPAIQSTGKNGGKNWAQGFQQRHAAQRIAANLKKNQALHIAALNPANPGTVNGTMSTAIPS